MKTYLYRASNSKSTINLLNSMMMHEVIFLGGQKINQKSKKGW